MIRQAQVNDFDSICFILDQLSLQTQKLNDLAYILHIQQHGFVMPVALTKNEFQKQLQHIFLVHDIDGKIDGFLRIDEVQEVGAEDYIDWLKPEYKESYISQNHRCIGKLAVLPSTERKGIATTLLREATTILKQSDIPYVFSFVAFSPVTNFPSMMFHEKNGFERIAISVSKHLYQMDNYRSFLYCKTL